MLKKIHKKLPPFFLAFVFFFPSRTFTHFFKFILQFCVLFEQSKHQLKTTTSGNRKTKNDAEKKKRFSTLCCVFEFFIYCMNTSIVWYPYIIRHLLDTFFDSVLAITNRFISKWVYVWCVRVFLYSIDDCLHV